MRKLKVNNFQYNNLIMIIEQAIVLLIEESRIYLKLIKNIEK